MVHVRRLPPVQFETADCRKRVIDRRPEVYWWRTDDFWRYALFATVAIIRASAEARGLTVEQVVAELGGEAG